MSLEGAAQYVRSCSAFTTCVPDIVEDWVTYPLFWTVGKTVRAAGWALGTGVHWAGAALGYTGLEVSGESAGGLIKGTANLIGQGLESSLCTTATHAVMGGYGMRMGWKMMKTSGFSMRTAHTNRGNFFHLEFNWPRTPAERAQMKRGMGLIAASFVLGVLPAARSITGWDFKRIG